MRRRLAWVAAALVGGYLLVLLVATLFQRSFLYERTPPEPPPAIKGLAVQQIRIDTADGQHLVAWWLPPQPGRPVMLFFNGNGGKLEPLKWRFLRLSRAGVGMLAVAYRGFSGSTGTPSEAGLRQDALAGYGWVAKRYPARDIVIHGFSLGTGVAVRLAAERPARALILEAPYTSLVEMASRQARWAPVSLVLWDRFRSSRWIGQVRTPVMIVHGDGDTVIPFAMGQRLYAEANAPKLFVRMHRSDHSTLVRDGMYDRVWPFIGVHAPPSLSAAALAPTVTLAAPGDRS